MELREALTQISEIRQQVARNEVFRGYRAVPVALSGVLALGGAIAQQLLIAEPARDYLAYLALWIGCAGASLLATGIEMALHFRKAISPLRIQMAKLAVGQFTPCILAGGLVMFAIVVYAREQLWMLPGLWQILFGLGVFASYRLLPRATFWIGALYLACGTACLTMGETALSPWAMGLPFGVGQLAGAAILYWTLERTDGEGEFQIEQGD